MVADDATAIFGKPTGSSAYQIIEQHQAFEQHEVAKAFQKICSSFEWKSTTEETTHAPCFAMLAVGDAFLVAKYSDAGRDAAGRPHTLRIECVLTDALESTWKKMTQAHLVPEPTGAAIHFAGDSATFNRS